MNIDAILDKLADFFVNFGVAAFAVAAFQGKGDSIILGGASLLYAIILASIVKEK